VSSRPARTTGRSQPLSRFIGRERERREIPALLSDERLVTLTGPGGVGKTRLAVEVASCAEAAFPDGVHFVDLSPLRAARLVPAAVAQALRLTEAPERPLEQTLVAALEDRRVLLVLDNFEHVLDAAPFVCDVLERCPGVRVLVTSREPLRLRGEREYHVPPLPLRSEDGPGEAIALFADRARAIEREFRLTEENAEAVAEVCRRLDGLPLAIELAAARTRVLTPRALLDRLTGGIGALDAPVRGVPERQQTLRRTIAWSYDLLTPTERRLFRRLSVFAGGWTLKAAEAVSEATGRGGVLSELESLVAKSLVQRREVGGDLRFALLETVREYATEALAAAGEERAARGAHASHYLALAEEGERGLRGPEQKEWLERLEREHDNLRAALEWLAGRAVAGDGDAAQAALRLAGALWRFWNMRGHHAEGKAWLRRVLDLPGAEGPTAARALALYGAGFLYSSRAMQEEGVAIQRARGDRGGLAYAQFGLGMALTVGRWGDGEEGDLVGAEAALRESLGLYREAGDRFGEAWAVAYLGQVAWRRGRHGEARALLEESLALRRKIGDLHGVASDLCALGAINLGAGEEASAGRQLAEGVQLWRMLGVRTGVVATAVGRLAGVARRRGDGAAAAGLYRESARMWRDLGDTPRAAEAEEEAEAERLTEARPGSAGEPSEERAAAYAWASPAARRAGLTEREWEVLALLVAGGSTASVASALGISPHTVVRHVSSILDKLDVSTRRAAVARALGTDAGDAGAVSSKGGAGVRR
jgi:predicted ATPase/DNA-binding CsgD family transcriptional regulator